MSSTTETNGNETLDHSNSVSGTFDAGTTKLTVQSHIALALGSVTGLTLIKRWEKRHQSLREGAKGLESER